MKTKYPAEWIIPIALVAIVTLYRLIRYPKEREEFLIFILFIPLIIVVVLGYDRFHRWRSKRLVRSILPSENLVANGLVSENISDETSAILVHGTGNRYRIYIADSRGSQAVISVAPELTSHTNKYDLKGYLELHTDQGTVHFAPRKSLSAFEQPDYAQEVLMGILANGIPTIK